MAFASLMRFWNRVRKGAEKALLGSALSSSPLILGILLGPLSQNNPAGCCKIGYMMELIKLQGLAPMLATKWCFCKMG